MPELKEETLVITLTLKEAIVAWSALNALGEDMENPTPYRIRAAELSTKLLQHIKARWPRFDSDDIIDAFQDPKHHQVPH